MVLLSDLVESFISVLDIVALIFEVEYVNLEHTFIITKYFHIEHSYCYLYLQEWSTT